MRVAIRRLPHGEGLPLPSYESEAAAGADVVAALEAPLTIPPLGRALVPTGFCVEIPDGHEIQVRPRSGLAARHGVTILNAPGTIDADFRGEVRIVLVNLSDQPFVVSRGERVAQLVLAPVVRAAFEAVDTLGTTERGTGGFGSTGMGPRG